MKNIESKANELSIVLSEGLESLHDLTLLMDSISLINAHLQSSEREIDLLLDVISGAEEGKASRVLISGKVIAIV